MTEDLETPTTAATWPIRAVATAAGVGAVGASIAAVLVATIGKAAGAPDVKQLSPGALITLTVLGVIIATITWARIASRRWGPRVLSVLVPVAFALSLLPDLALGHNGTAWSAVSTLMIAHAAVFALTVPVLLRWLPPHKTGVGLPATRTLNDG